MKKILSLALALMLCLSLSVTAFAGSPLDDIDSATQTDGVDDGTTGNNSDNTGVIYGGYNLTPTPTVYYVVVTWGNPTFSWTVTEATWDPANLKYNDDATPGSWKLLSPVDTNKVTLNNRSNAPVSVAITAAKNSTYATTLQDTSVLYNYSILQNQTSCAVLLGRATNGLSETQAVTFSLTGAPKDASYATQAIFNLTATISAADEG